MSRALRTTISTLAFSLAAAYLSACGGSSADDEARQLNSASIIAKNEPVRRFMVSEQSIARAPAGSVKRAFLQYWSDLQFQAWRTASQSYAPGLRDAIGDDVLIRALANQGPSYLASKPVISSIKVSGDRALIRYFRVKPDGATPASAEWMQTRDRSWVISFDPLLDPAVAQLRQLEVQQAIDPLAQKPIPAAVRVGNRARKLQSEYAGKPSTRDRSAKP